MRPLGIADDIALDAVDGAGQTPPRLLARDIRFADESHGDSTASQFVPIPAEQQGPFVRLAPIGHGIQGRDRTQEDEEPKRRRSGDGIPSVMGDAEGFA